MSDGHESRAHARLSPSGAKRWLNCPGSVSLSAQFPDTSSKFADEGTAAHELAERALREGKPAASYIGHSFVVNGDEYIVDSDMAGHVQVYVDEVNRLAGEGYEIELERKLDLSFIPGMGFGTGDCVAFHEKRASVAIVDLKYGRGVAVEVEENPQLIAYGMGALHAKSNARVEELVLTIVQPRCPHPDGPVRSFTLDAFDVLNWRSEFVAGAARVDAEPDLFKSGEWCRFCKAAAVCDTLKNAAFDAASLEFDVLDTPQLPVVTHMDRDELARRLKLLPVLEGWCKRVAEFAHAEAVAGRMPTGFKFVATRATRKWTDEANAIAAMSKRIDPWTRKLKSPAAAEKEIGKKEFGQFSELVEKKSSGVILVEESDGRPSVTVDTSADFETLDEE